MFFMKKRLRPLLSTKPLARDLNRDQSARPSPLIRKFRVLATSERADHPVAKAGMTPTNFRGVALNSRRTGDPGHEHTHHCPGTEFDPVVGSSERRHKTESDCPCHYPWWGVTYQIAVALRVIGKLDLSTECQETGKYEEFFAPVSWSMIRMHDTGCRALTKGECFSIFDAMKGRYGLRNRALFTLLRYTGFRVSEALSLQVEDVFDFRTGEVRGTITVRKCHMKGRQMSRTMPVHPELTSALKRYIEGSQFVWSRFAQCSLFPTQGHNRPITRQAAWLVLQEAADAAGVSREHLGTHSMRKTFASAVYNAPMIKGDLAKMAKLLGHSNPANTLSYIQFLDGSLEAAVLSA